MQNLEFNENDSITQAESSHIVQISKEDDNLHQIDNIDIVAIQEWLFKKNGIELFESIRALAFLCGIIDGFEEVFISIAKVLPKKLELDNLQIDDLFENIIEDKDVVNPFEYIKVLQKIFNETEYSKKIAESEGSFLRENLEELTKKFKIISMEEYHTLISNIDKIDSNNEKNTNNNNIDLFEEIILYSKNIKFRRKFLR